MDIILKYLKIDQKRSFHRLYPLIFGVAKQIVSVSHDVYVLLYNRHNLISKIFYVSLGENV